MAGWKDCIALRAGTPESGTVRGSIRFSAFTTINKEQNFPPDFGAARSRDRSSLAPTGTSSCLKLIV
jgi:hypothetical protein